jgi:hypothetical protein
MGPYFEFLRRFSLIDPPFSDFSALRSMILARSASIRSVYVFCFVAPSGGRAIRDFSGLYGVFRGCLDFWARICDLTPPVGRARRSFPFSACSWRSPASVAANRVQRYRECRPLQNILAMSQFRASPVPMGSVLPRRELPHSD